MRQPVRSLSPYYFRICDSLRSTNSQNLGREKVSLQRELESVSGTYPEADKSNPQTRILFL